MMDLTTTYLGMKLRSPFVFSVSPMSLDIDNSQHMESVQ
jgi:dihydroorotate dehydrogenase (fumarate)